MGKYTHVVTIEEENEGLDINHIINRNFNFSSRFRTKIKFQKLVELDGTYSPGYIKPIAGQIISIKLPEEASDFEPEDIPLDILYEDDDILVINKQPGITIHPTKGHPDHTMANALTKYMMDCGESYKIRFVNRLDMDTSGIVIAAKNSNAQNEITKQMRNGTVTKRYKALVDGIIDESISLLNGISLINGDPDRFLIDAPIGKVSPYAVNRTVYMDGIPFETEAKFPTKKTANTDEPPTEIYQDDKQTKDIKIRDALTEVQVLKRFKDKTLVELKLHTGRTHQIRVHMAYIGHPVTGDTLYNGDTSMLSRQALHSYFIEFLHPVTGKPLSVQSDLPDDMLSCMSTLE